MRAEDYIVYVLAAILAIAMGLAILENVIDNKQTNTFIQAGYEQQVDQPTGKVIWVKVQ
jgi:hypothetical protein